MGTLYESVRGFVIRHSRNSIGATVPGAIAVERLKESQDIHLESSWEASPVKVEIHQLDAFC